MGFGMVQDEARGLKHLESMGIAVAEQNLSGEVKAMNLCRAFRAGCHEHMRPSSGILRIWPQALQCTAS